MERDGSGLQSLVLMVNQLQDAFTKLGYEPMSLPQIAVVGGQSAGKSSVLENVVGKDFLPRGNGICTRRPLVLQLVHTPSLSKNGAYGEFLHKPNVKFKNFDHIRQEIEKVTDDETGMNKGISDVPINLRIYSRSVTNLTLVDLPGLTRVATGDQPENIEELIRTMMLKYITQENCIILAVHPANTDALQIAKSADRMGERTLGVLTKLDLMDDGTDAMDILVGKSFPLKLGWIPVVNRSQKDITNYKAIDAQWKSEKKYFESHDQYRTIAKRCGTKVLVQRLSKLLAKHIQHCLPEIKSKIETFMREKKEELSGLAELDNPAQKQRMVLDTAMSFAHKLEDLILGTDDDIPDDVLCGGAKLNHIFTNEFPARLEQVKVLEYITNDEINMTIKNTQGIRAGLFIPEETFEVLIRRAVVLLEEPAQECVMDCYLELNRIVDNITLPTMSRFEKLRERVIGVTKALIGSCLADTKELVRTLIKMEQVRINTDHPDFEMYKSSIGVLIAQDSDKHQRKAALHQRRRRSIEQTFQQAREIGKELDMDTAGIGPPGRSMMEGYVSKETLHTFRKASFERMYMVLRENRMIYLYDSKQASERFTMPLKQFAVKGTRVEFEIGGGESGDPAFRVSGIMKEGIRKDLKFSCTNTNSAQKWVHSLTIAAEDTMWENWLQKENEKDVENDNEAGQKEEGGKKKGKKPPPPLPSRGRNEMAEFPKSPRSAREKKEKKSEGGVQTEVLKRLLCSYFDIVVKKIRDSIPKAIILNLVEKVRETLQRELVAQLYAPDLIDELLNESESASAERRRIKEAIALMEKAMQTIKETQRLS
eukprot:g5520.t1